MGIVNHVGHCVADLDRSVAFYTEVFGFRAVHEVTVPDGVAAKLLRVEPPVGLRAVYLQLGGTVLELLHFDRPDDAPERSRSFTEPGLTHLSFTVEDLSDTCTLVTEHGGTVLSDTDVGGFAIMVLDPDGQVLELLPPGAAPV